MINVYDSTSNVRGQINAVLDVQFTEGVYGYGDEPVTLEEAKTYMKIDYDEDDTLITALIVAARQKLEKYLGICMIPKRVIAILQNDCGGIEIPYGPIYGTIDPTLITDAQDQEVSVTIRGGIYPFLVTTIDYVQLIYDAGFYELPEVLKIAIKAQVMFMYENRGERMGMGADGDSRYNPDYICNAAITLSANYKRVFDAII